MAPTPEEHASSAPTLLPLKSIGEPVLEDDDIVISGISGLYPEARNIKEFSDILYNKKNPITESSLRWILEHPELPQYLGRAPDLDSFDAQFFAVNYRLGGHMDPMSRKLLEHTYQAIYDAGLSPAHLSGKKVAVFTGSSFSDSETACFTSESKTGLAILGSSKTMFANRISYWLNIRGPSVSVDEADCSSTVALEQAFSAIRRGECEAAIVGGANLCLQPHAIIHHGRRNKVTREKKIKSYSENSDGYVLADSINVLFLQKAKDALRIYAQLMHVKNEYVHVINDETGPKYGYQLCCEKTAKFIKDFYGEVQVSPQAIEYVEGYGVAAPEVDKSELETIAQVYCKDRTHTLLVGSVTSNIGLTGAASGIAGITKVLLGYYKGELAANLNCDQPMNNVPAIRDGRIRIVNEHQPFGRTYAAINGMSYTGVNSHVLLCGHYKHKDLSRYKTSMPYLVTLSGRQQSNVENIFDNLKSRHIDPEEISLLHNIHSKNISGHLGRGFIILDNDADKKTVSVTEKHVYYNHTKRPLWFVYSGMGSQWAGMGAQLMQIPIFASAIERCRQVLAPKGLDIVDIITRSDKTIFDNILHSFVGIAAIQIGLTDILRALGLVPDGIIGHSVGELGCAYADGCLTAEEMILAAYSRGLVSLETPLIRGSMAAVGLGYNQVSAICPPGIDVACHNSSVSSTISGPADIMTDFVAQLTAEGVFAKEVPCSNIAYHSRYISVAGPKLLKYLKEVIKDPKPRSERWLSTSVPQDKWNEPLAKYCSAEYHTNNLLNPVLFEETIKLIPRNAVLVEIAPHGLLQAILKRSMPIECRSIPLTRRKDRENVIHLLRAIGDIYLEGFALNTQALYPKVQFPVSTETPMLSHLVDWMHSEKWKVASMNMQNKKYSSECTFKISVHDKEHGYLKDHVIRNKMCYPFAASLVAVWDMFAMYSGLSKRDVSVIFEDIHFYAQPLLFYQKALNLYVSLRKATGRFEIRTEHTRVATGRITQNVLEPSNILTFEDCYGENNNTNLTSDDIYRLLNDRGYNYTGDFRSIEWANASLTKAALVWNDNWITFIDGILQLNMLRQQYNDVSLLTYIRKISIDVREHSNNHVHQLNGKSVLQADVEDYLDYTRCGGVLVCNLQYCDLPKISHGTQIFSNWSSATENMLKMNPNKTDVANVVTLQIAEIGKLESMHWLRAPFIPRSNVTVTVHFAGLSLYDLRKAIGTISNENFYGMDYSGITKSGERVMGLLRSGAVSSCVNAHPELVWPVPEHWSLEDAATVPFAYAYAFYALVIKGHIEPGMNILIHEGTDALGQAAIAIALAYKCQVFATVSDTYSKVLLQKRFPQLQDEYIGSSRDISFSDSVLLATRGTGCDIIIGCVKGELKNVSLKCCRASGVLIDTIQILDREEYEYGMFYMTKGRSYLTVDFTSIFTNDARLDMKILHKLVCDGIAAGFVVPLSRVTYKPLEAEKAFKLLEKRNIGRVLICMCENMIPVQHRVICDPDQCQIMFWNNENLGIRIAEKLIYHGAKHLIIISNELTAYQSFKIRSWKNLEVKIEVFCEKVTQDLLKTNVLHDAFNLGTVQGVYVILTTDNSKEVMAEYASVLDQLDSLSRSLCHQLKNFVVMTPMKALGEKVCLSRVKSGFSATLLDISNIKNEKEIEDFDVMNAIESARCNNTVMFAAKTKQVQQTNPQSLSDQVIALAGIRIPQHADPDVTLQELGIAHEKRALVCAFLNVTYNLSLAENDVSLLTLQDINNLEQSVTEILPLNDSGLSTFISESKFNDLLATVDTILLPTLANKVASVENDFDITGNYLCIVPGIEGYHERFRTLCERLKLPAVVLQPGYDHPHETVKETAERYAEVLTKKTKMPSSFYILGYESGIFVAMELAAILEDQGLTGTVFYLGCAPSEFQTEVQEQLKEFETEEKLQNALVRHLCKLILGQDHDELDDELQNATSWTQIESIYIRYLTGRMLNSTQFASGLLKTTLARLLQAQRNIITVRRLRSKVVVLRAATERELPHDTILQQLSQQPVSVHQLNFPLSCVSRDMESSAIINQYLDIAILKAFDNMNLCETYI